MKEFPAVYPLLDGIIADGPLPKGDGSCSFSAIHEESGKKLTVMRISIPEKSTNANALVLAGVIDDAQKADDYYKEEVSRYKAELSAFATLSKHDSICGFLRYQVVPKEASAGYDIYILSKRRISLSEYLKRNNLSFEQGIALGLELCKAASDFRKEGYLHQHISLDSVFWDDNRFSVGGLGLCQLESLQSERVPSKYVGPFTPPEMCGISSKPSDTSDLYSIGMVLYFIFNGNHYPFEEAESSLHTANLRRIKGEALPAPMFADYELDRIIRKACSFNPDERYQSAAEFRNALEDYLSDSPSSTQLIVPPLVTDSPISNNEDRSFADMDEPLHLSKPEELSDDFKETFTPHDDLYLKRKKKKLVWLYVPLILFILLGGAFAYYRFYSSAVTVSGIEVEERGIDYLTVAVDSSSPDSLYIRCSAEDGSYSEIFRCSKIQTFSHLKANTVYNFSISPIGRTYMKGVNSLSSATLGYTIISDFSVEVSDNGTATLSMQVSGPEPEAWELLCFCGEELESSYPVENHTCTTNVLIPNTPYTFILNPGPDYNLSGINKASAIRNVEIHGVNLSTSYDGNQKAITAVWESDMDYPSTWTVSCSGGNGYHDTVETTDLCYTFHDIIGNSEYTVNVSNDSGSSPLLSTITVPAGTVSNLTASETDDGIMISWDYDGNYDVTGWKVSLINEEIGLHLDSNTDNTYYLVTDYLPDAEYSILLDTQYVTLLEGSLESSVKTKAAEAYEDNSEHNLGGTYTALYERPNENWTLGQLSKARKSFPVNTPFVFLIQAINIPKETEEEEAVAVLLVIRDQNGAIKYVNSYDSTWNDVWDVNLFAHEMETPSEAGSYTAEVYFNRYLLCSSPLTVTE